MYHGSKTAAFSHPDGIDIFVEISGGQKLCNKLNAGGHIVVAQSHHAGKEHESKVKDHNDTVGRPEFFQNRRNSVGNAEQYDRKGEHAYDVNYCTGGFGRF